MTTTGPNRPITIIQITRFAGRSGHMPRKRSRSPFGTGRSANSTITTASAGVKIIV